MNKLTNKKILVIPARTNEDGSYSERDLINACKECVNYYDCPYVRRDLFSMPTCIRHKVSGEFYKIDPDHIILYVPTDESIDYYEFIIEGKICRN